MLELQEAIERAELMAGEDRLLNQQSYELIADKLDQEDLYPFTMALTERGVFVRTSRRNEDRSYKDLVLKAKKVAQSFVEGPEGLWVPEGVGEDELSQIHDALENYGLNVTSDGKVEFYSMNIPGLFKEQKPQYPMPIETAAVYFQQLLTGVDVEKNRVHEMLDILTRLNNAADTMEDNLLTIDSYKFSPSSKSPVIRTIAEGLVEIKAFLAEGNLRDARAKIKEIRDTLDQYAASYDETYQQHEDIVNSLNTLVSYQQEDPAAFDEATKSMGGLAASVLAQMSRDDYTPDPKGLDDMDVIYLDVPEGFLMLLLGENAVGGNLADVVGVDELELYLKDALEIAKPNLTFDVTVYEGDQSTDIKGEMASVRGEGPDEVEELFEIGGEASGPLEDLLGDAFSDYLSDQGII